MNLDNIDWSFSNLSNTGLHAFHWYPATYLSAIPGTLIPHFSDKGSVVLDPFCGSGTTGLEAVRLGRKFIGIDTNPVALLITYAKLHFDSPATLKFALSQVIKGASAMFSGQSAPMHPNHTELLGWYHPQTLDTLNNILCEILKISSAPIKKTLLAIFSAILKTSSSQGRHWGWVCDNVKPRVTEIVYKDALTIFSNAVNEFAKSSEHAFREAAVHSSGLTRDIVRKNYKLHQGDCIQRMKSISSNSIDLISTSPPYFGVADYIKSQRLTYLWLDKDELISEKLGFRQFENLRASEAGARSNRHRIDSHTRYMTFMNDYFIQCRRILKDNSAMTMVIGESQSRSRTIEELVALAPSSGLVLDSRHGRDIRANRRRLMAKVKGEEILIFRSSTATI